MGAGRSEERDIAIAGFLVGQEDFFSLRILFQLFSFLFRRGHGRLRADVTWSSRKVILLTEERGWGKDSWTNDDLEEADKDQSSTGGLETLAELCLTVQNCVPGSIYFKCRSSRRNLASTAHGKTVGTQVS